MHIPVFYVMKTSSLIAVWIFCCLSPVSPLLQKAARIDKARSDRAKSTPLGKEVALKCVYTGNPPPEVHWAKDGKKLVNKCKFCVQKVENFNGRSTLRVTPYRDSDFGDYKCRARNKLGFGHITMKLQEDKTKNITQCKRDRILARDPRLRLEFLPRCDADGSYHVIQCSVHLDKCWCVDQSGHKIADAYDGHKGKYCGRKKTKDMAVIAAIVLSIACALLLLLIDIICHVKKNKGVINRLIRHRNRRRTYSKLKGKDEASKSTEKQDETKAIEEP